MAGTTSPKHWQRGLQDMTSGRYDTGLLAGAREFEEGLANTAAGHGFRSQPAVWPTIDPHVT